MQPGWNLENTFDALNSWGDPKVVQNAVTKEFIKEIKKQGFKSIGIPITWGEHMGGAPDYKIEPAAGWIGFIKEYSWKICSRRMIMSLNSLKQQMLTKAKGLGYDEFVKWKVNK